MKKISNSNKLALVALVALLIVGTIGSTFAYFVKDVAIENVFKTSAYSIEVTEEFTPPTDWMPGDTTDKTVKVENKAGTPIIVRVWFEEEWETKNGGTLNNVIANPSTEWTKYVDASIAGSVPSIEAAVKNISSSANWKAEGGYYYYTSILAPGASATDSVLESVTFNPAIVADLAETTNTVGSKTTIAIGSTGDGYDDATYKLTVHVQLLQALKEAMVAEWSYDTSSSSGVAYDLYSSL